MCFVSSPCPLQCAICRNLIMELCIECQANRGGTQSSSGHNDECTVAWGPTRRHGLGRARKGGGCNPQFFDRVNTHPTCDRYGVTFLSQVSATTPFTYVDVSRTRVGTVSSRASR